MIARVEYRGCAFSNKSQHGTKEKGAFIEGVHLWRVHLRRVDCIVTNPYWSSEKLQKKRLNVIHFWHDREFKNVWMSVRFQNTTSRCYKIIDEPIL